MGTRYYCIMFRVLLIIVTGISLAAISFAVQAHEAGMASIKDHGLVTQHTDHMCASMSGCADGKTCKADARLCAFVCHGQSARLPLDRISIQQYGKQEKFIPPNDVAVLGTSPRRNDRPPISRLL